MRLNAGKLFTRPYLARAVPWAKTLHSLESRCGTLSGYFKWPLSGHFVNLWQVPSESRQHLEANSGKARDYLTILKHELGVTDTG